MKNQLDFPNYMGGDEVTRFWPTANEKQLPEQTRMNYVIELLSNDRDSFESLVEISRLMSMNDVELRALNTLKQLMTSQENAHQSVSFERLNTELFAILQGYNDQQLMQSKIMAWLRTDESQSNAQFDRVNNMVEFLQCYALEVKKNKNASNRMDDILHMREKDSDKLRGAPQKTDLDRATKVMMFIWQKMLDQQKNIAQSFKIFDRRDKGKLKKADFVTGLEHFTINLSGEDQDAVWDALDAKKRGYLVFEDFSKLHQSEKQKIMDDPYLHSAIQTHVQDSLAAERKKERDRIAQELLETMSSKLGSASAYRYSQQAPDKNTAHGIGQLPSDNINELMHNTYNKIYN